MPHSRFGLLLRMAVLSACVSSACRQPAETVFFTQLIVYGGVIDRQAHL